MLECSGGSSSVLYVAVVMTCWNVTISVGWGLGVLSR